MSLLADAGPGVDLLALHRLDPQRYPCLLESAAPHPATARYDLLFAFPEQVLEARGSRVVEHRNGQARVRAERNLLQALAAELPRTAVEPNAAGLPFAGGWCLYLGYETAACIEPRLRLPNSPHQLPDALAIRCRSAVIVDRVAQRSWCVAADAATLEMLQTDLHRAAQLQAASCHLPPLQLEEDPPGRFLDGVGRVHDYLRAGDTFQVNLSRAWRARFEQAPDPADLYARLRRTNPAPFAGLLRWADSALLSSSPERLVECRGHRLETRPIAGTAPRGADAAADAAARARLQGSLKDRAEHVMLLDLERNDLGRVCRPGSVQVAELLGVESYALVHHLVSSVRGERRDGVDASDIVRALFPGGTITGCPKVRAMEIIAELEAVGRGPYTGSLGYVSDDGQMDLNILIRSLLLEDRVATLRAGAGIVADSDAMAELAETRAKARALLRALDADPAS